jgi:hypothetical protein
MTDTDELDRDGYGATRALHMRNNPHLVFIDLCGELLAIDEELGATPPEHSRPGRAAQHGARLAAAPPSRRPARAGIPGGGPGLAVPRGRGVPRRLTITFAPQPHPAPAVNPAGAPSRARRRGPRDVAGLL